MTTRALLAAGTGMYKKDQFIEYQLKNKQTEKKHQNWNNTKPRQHNMFLEHVKNFQKENFQRILGTTSTI